MGAQGHVCQAVTRASTVNTEYRNNAPSASGSAAGMRREAGRLGPHAPGQGAAIM